MVAILAAITPPISLMAVRCGRTDYSHVKTLPWKIANADQPDRNQCGKLFDFEESLWFGIAHLLTPFHMLRNHELAGWEAFCVVEMSMPPRRFRQASPEQSKPTS